MKIVTRASVPDALAKAWLQHLRDFDTAHPGCHFEVLAYNCELSTEAMVESLKISPALGSIATIKREDENAQS